jgi:tetratricopeptide (TPR) repeat protein
MINFLKMNHGAQLVEERKFEEAIQWYRLELERMRRSNANPYYLIPVLMPLARALARVSKFDEALAHFQESLTIMEQGKKGSSEPAMRCLINMADCYTEQREWTKALECARRIQRDGKELAYQGLFLMARVKADLGKWDKAHAHIVECFKLFYANSEQSANALHEILHLKSMVDFERGDIDSTLRTRLDQEESIVALYGTSSVEYASWATSTARILLHCKQVTRAVALMKRAVCIHKILSPADLPSVEEKYAMTLAMEQTPKAVLLGARTTLRVCSISGCKQMYRNMDRCNTCNVHYVCTEHVDTIFEHMGQCIAAPDVHKRFEKKCRRCLKKGVTLQKCGKCGQVQYCSALCCQNDWHRHKQHCK